MAVSAGRNGAAKAVAERYIPALSWLPSYQRRLLSGDAVAGLTVWALMVPESVAYAQIAGVPPENGIYAAIAGLLGYAIFGTTRAVVVGTTAGMATVVAATVSPISGGDPGQAATLAALLALLTAAVFFGAGLARLGWVAQFISRPVMAGFVFGMAFVIAVGQVPKLLGVPKGEGDVFQAAWDVVTELGDTDVLTLVIGLAGIGLMFGLRKFAPRVPASITVVLLSVAASALFDFGGHGVALVGSIPRGLPVPEIPTARWTDVTKLLGGAFGLALIGLSEHMGAASRSAAKGTSVDVDQEFVALGSSNLFSGLFQGLGVGGSLSKTEVALGSGAHTQMESLVAFALMVLTALVLMPLFTDLPEATLAAVVLFAIRDLFATEKFARYFRLSRTDFALAMSATIGVLTFGVLAGMLLGVGLSVLALVYNAARPSVSALGRRPITGMYFDMARAADAEPVPGMAIARLNAPLFFANAEALHDRVRQLTRADGERPAAILLDFQATDTLDITSTDMLRDLNDELRSEHIELFVASVVGPVRDMLRRSGLYDDIGESHICPTVEAAAEAFRGSRSVTPDARAAGRDSE